MSTPLEISIALHYWTRPGDYGAGAPDFNIDAPAVIEQRQQMVNAGLLVQVNAPGRRYDAGPALECYVTALCNLPWPVQQWVMPVNIHDGTK